MCVYVCVGRGPKGPGHEPLPTLNVCVCGGWEGGPKGPGVNPCPPLNTCPATNLPSWQPLPAHPPAHVLPASLTRPPAPLPNRPPAARLLPAPPKVQCRMVKLAGPN